MVPPSRRMWRLVEPIHAVTYFGPEALDALERIAAMKRAFPRLRVIYGHEPSQWPEGARSVELTGS